MDDKSSAFSSSDKHNRTFIVVVVFVLLLAIVLYVGSLYRSPEAIPIDTGEIYLDDTTETITTDDLENETPQLRQLTEKELEQVQRDLDRWEKGIESPRYIDVQ